MKGVAPSVPNEADPANVFIHPAGSHDEDTQKRTVHNTGFIDLSNITDFIDIKKLTNIFNAYSNNKNIANGFFNISLVASNFSQMKLILFPPGNQIQTWAPLAITSLVFVCVSLLLQFLLAFILVFLAKNGEFLDEAKRNTLIRNNNISTIIVFFITILNICINVFNSI
jgi:hypothetical protein